MIITLSNQYGAGAIAIGERVAAALGYHVVDRQLPVVVAKRMRVARADVEAVEDTGKSLGERLLTSLERSTPELAAGELGVTFDAQYLHQVQDAVRQYAARGNVVLIGRAAGIILGRRPDLVRAFLYAPRDWRVQRIVRDLGLDVRSAQGEVERVDRERQAHLRDWYDVEFGNPQLYDVLIDTSAFGDEGSADLLIAATKSRA